MNKTATTIIIILIIALGAWLILRERPMNANTGDMTGDTQLAGSENPDNGMVGGDANVNVDIGAGGGTSASPTVREFTVDASNYKFAPTTMTVNRGDTVRITLKNGQGQHDLKVDDYDVKTRIITTGQTDTIEFVADKAGTFEYYCTVGNHRAMGMEGTLTVK